MLPVEYDNAAAFYLKAGKQLEEFEAENCQMLGLCHSVVSRPGSALTRWFGVEQQGCVLAAAALNPRNKLSLSSAPDAAIACLVDALLLWDIWPELLFAPQETARTFSALWGKRTGSAPRQGMTQRIYQLERITPTLRAGGCLRLGSPGELEMLVEWARMFGIDARLGDDPAQARATAEAQLRADHLYVWEDKGPVTMAAWSGPTRNGARIQMVFTAREHRGKGYALSLIHI